ncbi:MAG: rhodanese-like domain-containing protein, partial [Actinomycetes bacterium]
IPMGEVVERLDEVPDPVICVCAVGARSDRVAEYLTATGRTAANLDGGLQAWTSVGGPLEA